LIILTLFILFGYLICNFIYKPVSQNALKDQLLTQIDSNTSIYFQDINNGSSFGINENKLYSPASLIKVPLLIALLKESETDPSILDKEILNTESYDPKVQNIQPQVTLIPNKKYTIKQLIEQMIIYSDDISYNLLNQQTSADKIIKIYNDLNIDISQALSSPKGDIISAKDYTTFFRILYNSSYLNPTMSKYALKILGQTDFKDGIVASIPPDINVSHKFGERQYLDTGSKQLHDCGIVYYPNKPYLLCIMTRGDNFESLKSKIKNISKTVYDNISLLNYQASI